MARDTPLVALDHVTKRFKAHVALASVSLAFHAGELHAVVGENGAGKSTLMNILFGLHEPDEGAVLVEGREVRHKRPSDAIAHGIGMVHQHFQLVPSFSVAENLRLAALPHVRKRLRRHRDIATAASGFGLSVDPAAETGALPLAIQQRVEILKALLNEARLLILDEPTTILNPQEAEALYAVLKRLARAGHAVVVVTHHLDEVLAHSDRVSVIRHGRLVGSAPTASLDKDQLVRQIVGRAVALEGRLPGRTAPLGSEELRLESVRVRGTAFSSGLRGISLSLRAGEVVGIAGVEGNGQRELFDILSGLRQPDRGTVHIADRSAMVGLVPEDRHTEGLVLDLPVSLNLVLDRLDQAPFSRYGRLRHGAIAARARDLARTYDVRAASLDHPARLLSGGNQQKLIIGRALSADARVLVVYQPTRGLDVAASEDVLARIRAAANAGLAVILISSNLPETIRTSDRVLVLYEGAIAGEVAGEQADIESIGHWMSADVATETTEPHRAPRARFLALRSGGVKLIAVIGSFVASLAIGLLILASLGVAPGRALAVMVSGAVGSPTALADTLVFMAPRLLVALGAVVALRCGVFNLGGEGQLQMGAIGAVLPATLLPPSLGWLSLSASLLLASAFGALWAMIPAALKLWRGANEIIVTLMMNFIGIYFVKYLVQGPLQPPGSEFNMSARVSEDATLPILFGGTRLHAGVLLALVAAVAVWFLLYHTTYGIHLRATGLSPRAARLQRLPTRRLLVGSMAISGAIAGLAGATEVLGVQYRLIDGFSANIGFDGLAIAFLGSLEPLATVLVALYFGAISSGTVALQSTLSVPGALSDVMTGLPILILACVHGVLLLKGRPLWQSTR